MDAQPYSYLMLIIAGGYVILLYAVTLLTRRRSQGGLVAYLMAGRNMPSWMVAFLLTGLAVGGASTVGVAERAYSSGLSAGWYNAAWAAGAILVGLVAARRYREMRINTLPELFEHCYSTPGRILGVLGQLVIQIVITSLQYVAGGAILSALLPDIFTLQTGALVTAVVFVGITLIGGLWAAGLTNLINVLVIYVGIILAVILALTRVGGLGKLSLSLPPQHPGFELGGVGWGLILGWFMVMCTQAFSTQAVVQVGFAARDENTARWGYLLAGLFILPVGFLSALLGMAAATLMPGIIPTEALPRLVLDLHPVVAGLVLSSLWAADISTAVALLLGSATLVMGDLVKPFVRKEMAPRTEAHLSRLVVLAVSLLTYLLATQVSGILKTLLIGLTLSTAYTLVALATIFTPSLCRRGTATWVLLATMIALLLWVLLPQSHFLPHPIYFTWLVSLGAFFLVALMDRRPARPWSGP